VTDNSEFGIPNCELPRKPVIGLAGGIGSGKSTVAAAFARLGCLVLDSDEQAHEVLQRPDVIEQVRKLLGDPTLDAGDPQMRRKIAARVFGWADLVARLNELIHPAVHAMRHEAIAAVQSDPEVVAIVLDTPLLFEAGVDAECDATVFIEAPLEQRQRRVAESRGWSPEDLDRRQRHQMDLDEKRRRCKYVIRNESKPAELDRQAKEVLEKVSGT
jgi:dephospho-CoA kinase